MNWLKRFIECFKGKGEAKDLLVLKSENQGLRLELKEKEEKIIRLKQELLRVRDEKKEQEEKEKDLTIMAMIERAAASASQITLLSHLLEQGKEIRAVDVLTVAKNLLSVFKEAGLEIIGRPGEEVRFDPNLHEPITEGEYRAQEKVIIKFPAVSFKTTIVYKAKVAKE